MRKQLERAFALIMTALLVFECVPTLAWAEAAERLGQAAGEASQALPLDADQGGEPTGEAVPLADGQPGDESAAPTDDGSMPADDPAGIDPANAIGSDVAAAPSDDPANETEPAPIASDVPAAIANLSETDKADPEKSGLITYRDDGIDVAFRNHPKSSSSGFALDETVTHEDEQGKPQAVWKSSASQTSYDTSYSTMVFDVSKPCYVVFDYLLASKKYGDSSANNSSLEFAYTSKASATDSISSFIPNAEQRDVDAAGLADPSNWRSAVLYLNATDGFGAWFEHTLAGSKYDENELHSAYISNLRFYGTFEQVPASCKVHLTVETTGRESTPQFSSPFPTDGKNGDVWLPKDGLVGGSSYDIPLNSMLFKKGAPDRNECLEKGYSIIGPDGSPVYEWAPEDGICSYKITEPGNYTLKGEYEPFIPILTGFTLSVDTDGDGTYEDVRLTDDDLATIWKSSPDGEFSCVRDLSTDSEGWAWKVSYDAGVSATKLTAYDESGIELDPQAEGTSTIFIIKPGKARRNIKLVFSAEGHAERTLTLCFTWSEKPFSESFPTVSLSKMEVGMHNDFDEKVKSYQSYTLSDADNQYRAFLFDPEKADAAHEIVYATSQSNQSKTTYSFNFKWSKQVEGLLSFDYLVVPYGEETESTESSAKYTFSVEAGTGTKAKTVASVSQDNKQIAWSHVEIPISSSIDYGSKYQATVEMAFTTPTYGAYAAISNVAFDSETRDVTVNIEGNGTVSNDGEAVTTGQKFTKYGGGHLNLTAKAASGSTFAGWYENGKLVSGNPSFDYVVNEAATLTAKFVTPSASDEALVMASDGTSAPYPTLDAALDAAVKAGDGTFITLLRDATLAKSATVPKGVTLLVPCKDGDGGYDPVSGFNPEPTSTTDPTATYRTLTIPKDVTLTVEGTLLVNAVSGHPSKGSMINTEADGVNAAVKMYGHGKVSLVGSIDVKGGGKLDSFGYVEGTGGIHAESGATVGDLFVVRHWRGGTVASNMYFANIFPFSEYSCRNIKAPVTIESGASYEGLVRMYALSTSYNTRFPLINNENGLIRLANGASATKTYDATRETSGDANKGHIGVETIAITGGATFEQSTLDIAGMNLTTAEFIYPWDGSHAFQLNNGTYTFENDMKFMPGAAITATRANIVIDASTKVALYDASFVDSPPVASDGKTVMTPTAYTTGSGTAATLTLDAASSLTNNGSFSGTVVTAADNVKAGSAGRWAVASKEPNGANKRTIDLTWASGDAKLSRPGFTWKFASNNRDIVWSGADYSGLDAVLKKVPADADLAKYTDATVSDLKEAKQEAQKLRDANLGADRQSEIDGAASALEAAIAALELKTFTITFSAGAGAELQGEAKRTVEYGAALAASEFPTAVRPGYDFKGWEEDGKVVTELKDVTAAHTLTATWEAHRYTIKYEGTDAVEGVSWPDEANHPATYSIEDAVTLATPERTGYEFAGWTVTGAEADGAQPTDGTIPTGTMGDLTATASWTPLTFKVTLDPNGGTLEGSHEVEVTYDALYPSLPESKREGWIFGGWEVADEGTEPGSGTPVGSGTKVKVLPGAALRAVWTHGEYSIAYKEEDGTPVTWPEDVGDERHPEKFYVDTPAFTIPDLERKGYTFLGWDDGSDEPKMGYTVPMGTHRNLVLTAKWQLNSYDITLKGNGGTFDAASETKTIARHHFDTLGELPSPSRTAYELTGWKDDVSNKVWTPEELSEQVVSGPMTLVAQWAPVEYKITFNLDSGSWAPGDEAEWSDGKRYTIVDEDIQLPTPVREGYTFNGWQASGGFVSSPNTDLESGLIAQGSWGNVTLTAEWKVNSHTLTWDYAYPQGLATPKKEARTLDFSTSYSAPEDPTCAGYRFEGWDDGTGTPLKQPDIVNLPMPDKDVTYIAKWKSYTSILNEHVEAHGGDASALSGDDLETARIYYAKLAEDPSQARAWDTASLSSAVEAELRTTIARDVHDAIDDVNKALAPDGATIATLSETDLTTDTGTPILDVELVNPSTKCASLINNGFLVELFKCEDVKTVTVGQQECDKTQFNLMYAVAWEALHDDMEIYDRDEFTKWLSSVQSTLEIRVLAGCQVSANLNGRVSLGLSEDGSEIEPEEGREDDVAMVSVAVPYCVRFYEQGTSPAFKDVRTIEFDVQGGSPAVGSITKRPGLKVEAPAAKPTKIGYDFEGWYTEANGGGEKYVFTVMPEASITLFAKWTPYPYTVTFDAGATGASGSMDAQGLVYDQNYELPGCGFERTGYSFAGWQMPDGTVKQAGTEVSRLTTEKNGSVTLKATWAANTYTLTFDPGEGEMPDGAPAEVEVTYGLTYPKLPEPTRTGWAFDGWYAEDAQIVEGTTVELTGDVELTARYHERGDLPYEVHYWLQDLEPNLLGAYGYTEAEDAKVTGTGAHNAPITATEKPFEGFDVNREASELEGVLTGEGALVLNVRYDRKTYEVTWKAPERDDQVERYRYQEELAYPGEGTWETDAAAYELMGWGYATEDGSEPQKLETLPLATDDMVLQALFHKAYEAETPDGAHTWRTLQIAMEKAPELLGAAASGEATASAATPPTVADPVTGAERVLVSLHGEPKADGAMEPVSVPASGLTVPEGVMLLLPYTDGDTGYHPEQNNNQNIPGPPVNPHVGDTAAPTPYSTLDVPAGATLTIEGTVLVNALIGHKAGGYHVQDVTGGWALLQLGDGAQAVVGDGGTLDCHGYVRGDGTVTAEPGGTVGDLYVVQHWRGGTQALDAYGERIYPMNETDCRHVEVPLTIEAGGRLDGLVTMNASFGSPNAYFSTRFPQVDNENGILRLHEGASATRTLVERKGEDGEKAETREHWEITGGADFSRSTLYIIEMNLSTGGYVYPIDGDTDWILSDGDYAFTEDFKFMPGAKIEAHGADLTVAGGKTVVLYEPFDDPENTGDTQYPNDRPAAELTLDAGSTLTNNGTFAGKVSAAGPDVHEAQFDVGWEATTEEVNGYCVKPSGVHKTADEFVRHIDHGLEIDCPDHEYEISDRGEVLWDGEESDFHPEEELARAVKSAAGKADALEGLSAKATLDGADVELAIDLQSEARASGSAISAVEDVVTALLDALERDSDMAATASAGAGKDRYSVDLSKDTAGLPVRDLAKALGLVAAAGGDGATGADLAGKSATLTVAGTGYHAGASVRLTLSFACSWEPAVAPSSPTAAPDTSELEPEAASIVEAAEPGRVELNGGGGDEAAPVEVAATVTDADAVTWTVTLADEAQEKPAADVAGSVIGSFLSSVAKSPEAVSRVSTVTGNPPEVRVELKDGGLPEDGLARILAKLGLAPASAQAQALADEPSSDDRADTAGDVLVGESYKLLAESPRGDAVTFTFAFRAAPEAPADPHEGLVAVYRLYNPNTGEHLLTSDAHERDVLGGLGWDKEGIASWQPKANVPTASALELARDGTVEGLVFRMYNPSNGDHLLTMMPTEVDGLRDAGWRFEGVAFASAEDAEGARPVWRLWNPNMTGKGGAGSHLYTADAHEYDVLGGIGWKREGRYWSAAWVDD